MFGYISGNILAIDEIMITLLASGTGIGFDIFVSPTVLSMNKNNDTLSLWIHHHKTEVSESLFGFFSEEERRLFRQLIKVNGVGGKTALALLGLGEEDLIRAIHLEDDKLIASVPGIGRKTAQKIIVELKGSIDLGQKNNPLKEQKSASNIQLMSALIGMGYDKTRVEQVIENLDSQLPIDTRTIEAIRILSK